MSSALTEFIGLLVGGISEMAQGIGSGLNQAVTDLFLATDSTTHAVTGLSTFGGVTAIFAGIALRSWINYSCIPLGNINWKVKFNILTICKTQNNTYTYVYTYV